MDYTVTIAGPERHEGHAPYTYVTEAKGPEHAKLIVLELFRKEQETYDVLLISCVEGVPEANARFYWNDLRDVHTITLRASQRRLLQSAIDHAIELLEDKCSADRAPDYTDEDRGVMREQIIAYTDLRTIL